VSESDRRPSFGGRLILITGASAGIGRAAALAFAREGARVVALARRMDRMRDLVAEAGGIPPRIVAIEGTLRTVRRWSAPPGGF